MTQTQWHQTMVDNTFCAVSDFSRSRSNCSAVTFSCNRNNSEFCCCLVWRHFLTLPIQSKSQPENCLSREPEGHISTASNTTNTAKSLIFVCPLLHKLQYVNKIRKVKKTQILTLHLYHIQTSSNASKQLSNRLPESEVLDFCFVYSAIPI